MKTLLLLIILSGILHAHAIRSIAAGSSWSVEGNRLNTFYLASLPHETETGEVITCWDFSTGSKVTGVEPRNKNIDPSKLTRIPGLFNSIVPTRQYSRLTSLQRSSRNNRLMAVSFPLRV